MRYGYDRQGRTVLSESPAGRLIEVVTGAAGSERVSRFAYDGAGNRLRAVRDGVSTRYLHDVAGNVVAELDGSGALTRYYLHGLGLLGMVEAGGPHAGLYVTHADGTGHVVALSDASGALTHRYAYGSFGEVWAEEERFAQPFTYAGQAGVLRERAHGLYHMRARYYQVASQRFISEDPSGFNGGLNLYAYVGGNPLGFVDPSGLAGQEASLIAGIRAPDFLNFQVDLYVGSVWGTFTRDGSSFTGAGVRNPFVGNALSVNASVSFGWLNQFEISRGQVDRFIGGYAGAGSTAFGIVGGGLVASPGNGTATLVGVGVGASLLKDTGAPPDSFWGGGFTVRQGQALGW